MTFHRSNSTQVTLLTPEGTEIDITPHVVTFDPLTWTAEDGTTLKQMYLRSTGIVTARTTFSTGVITQVGLALGERRSPTPPKYRCSWCGGVTYDDSRGNCAACGDPRD